jgi:hypothetical protein
MELFARMAAMHPLVIAAWIGLIAVNVFLIHQAGTLFEQQRTAHLWPRLDVRADGVDLQRVVNARQSAPIAHQSYEAIFSFRYEVDGSTYTKQTVRSVSDRGEAERLKESQRLSFYYNPANPDEIREEPPGKLPFILTLAGIFVINGIGMGLISNLGAFFGGK